MICQPCQTWHDSSSVVLRLSKEYSVNMDQKVCRICLESCEEHINLFISTISNTKKPVVEFLREFTHLEIQEEDVLPNSACVLCVNKLSECYKLLQQCLSSNKTLLEMVQTGEKLSEIQHSEADHCEHHGFGVPVVKPKYACTLCNSVYNNKAKYTRHLKIHNAQPHKCEECSQTFTKRLYLKVHQRTHTRNEEKSFTCKTCDKQFMYGYLLKQHEFKHNAIKPYPCTICDKGCLTAENLRRHMKIHDRNYVKKKHMCDVCLKEFLYPSFLTEHMRIHTGEKPHLCSICGKGFRQSGALHYHQRIHTNYKPFTCEVCNGNFMSQSVLKVHMRKHTNERPFVCHICGVAFRQSTDLKSHQRTHSGDKPVLCTICGKRMSTTGQLTIHLRSHTGEKPFACTKCPKAFTTRTMLVKHDRIHTGERPYVCDICGKAFTQSSTLKKHKTTHEDKNKERTVRKKSRNGSSGKIISAAILHSSQEDENDEYEIHEAVQYTVILPAPVPFTHNL